MMTEITNLAEYGLTGVCISLVLLIAFLFNRIFRFISNHMVHETEAWNKNTEVLTKLSEKISQDIKSQADVAKTLRELKSVVSKIKK